MKSHYSTWVCVLGTGTLAGVLLGTLLTGPADRRASVPLAAAPLADPPLPAVLEDDAPPPFVFDPPPSDVRVADLRAEIAAIGDEEEAKPAPPKPAPQVLPPAHREATPLSAAREKLVREIIAERLPHASSEEQDVWYEELKGLDPDVLVEVLNIRNSLGAIVPLPPIQFDILPERTPVPDQLETPEPIVSSPIDDLPRPLPIAPPRTASPRTPVVTIAPENAFALENTLVSLRQAERILLDNVANASTTGFRRRRPIFATEPSVEIHVPAVGAADDHSASSHAAHIGNGSYLAAAPVDTTPGRLRTTGRPLDVAIVGAGWLAVQSGNRIVYTRAGELARNADGQLVTPHGLPLDPAITIPNDATRITIGPRGVVSVDSPNTTEPTRVGTFQLARFVNPDGLVPLGDNLFAESEASGAPSLGPPGADGRGELRQGRLESSNVHLEHERRELLRLHAHIAAITALLGPSADDRPLPPPDLVLESPRIDLGRATISPVPSPSAAPLPDAPEVLVKESDQVALESRIDRARKAIEANRFDEAADLYEAMLEADPRNVAALHGLGILAGRRGAHAEAQGRFLDALRVDPKNAGLLNDLGFAYLMQEQFEKAEARFQRALEVEPNHRLAIGNLAGLCARLGREEEALALFRRIGPEEQAREEVARLRRPSESPTAPQPPSPDRTASADDPLPELVPQPRETTVE